MSKTPGQPDHHWPDEDAGQPATAKKKGRLARIGDEIADAVDTAAVGGAMGTHIPEVGRNPLVDHRAMIKKVDPKSTRE